MRFNENRLMSIADYSLQNIDIVSFLLCVTRCGDGVLVPGLELDFPIVCWGNDFIWNGEWKSPPAKRSKAKDPHQLRVNSYRVLLTRGRNGFIVFVPNEIGMQSTYEALKGVGFREMKTIEIIFSKKVAV
jgi:hypothetical protein